MAHTCHASCPGGGETDSDQWPRESMNAGGVGDGEQVNAEDDHKLVEQEERHRQDGRGGHSVEVQHQVDHHVCVRGIIEGEEYQQQRTNHAIHLQNVLENSIVGTTKFVERTFV